MRALRTSRAVHAPGTRVAGQLSAQAARASPKHLPNVAQAPALLPQRRQRHALFGLHLSKSSRHPHTLPGGKVLHFRLETATPN
jgi:hypothetical protein